MRRTTPDSNPRVSRLIPVEWHEHSWAPPIRPMAAADPGSGVGTSRMPVRPRTAVRLNLRQFCSADFQVCGIAGFQTRWGHAIAALCRFGNRRPGPDGIGRNLRYADLLRVRPSDHEISGLTRTSQRDPMIGTSPYHGGRVRRPLPPPAGVRQNSSFVFRRPWQGTGNNPI